MRSGLTSRAGRAVPPAIRAAIRYLPPRGRGIRLAHEWTRRRPPDGTVYVSREPGGARLQCDLRDHLSRVLYYRGWMDAGLESWIRGWLRPGDVYADVGAHIGYLAALAARAVGPAGRVVAFEPSPETCAKLRTAFAGGDFPQVEVVNAAVAADHSGEATLFTADGVWENQAYRNSLHPGEGLRSHATVATVSLDGSFPSGQVRLLKVDVEGGEMAVLSGAEELLASGRCEALVVELNPEALARAGSSVAGLVDRLDRAGYDAYRCDPVGTLLPWRPVDVQTEFEDAVFLPGAGTTCHYDPRR